MEENRHTEEEIRRNVFRSMVAEYADSLSIPAVFDSLQQRELFLDFMDGLYDRFAAFFAKSEKATDEHQPPQTIKSHNIGESDYSEHRIQVWDIVDEYNLDFYEGNILKYLLRRKGKDSDHRNTNRFMDLQKLIHYAQRKMERLEK